MAAFPLIAAFTLCVTIAAPLVRFAGAQSGEGHVAEVADRSGSKMTVTGFHFGYKYGYTRSNCMFACSAVGDATLDHLPVNDACGVSMVPLRSIKSVESIIAPKNSNESFGGTVTYVDGRSETIRFGTFGGERLEDLKGSSALGAYSLAIAKAASVTLLSERFVEPKHGRTWSNDGKLSVTVTCPNGASTTLTRGGVFPATDNGTPGVSAHAALKFKVGESEIDVALEKIRSAALKPEPNKDREFALTTTSGDVIDARVVGSQWLVAGYKTDGTFYYARIADLKEFAIAR